MKHVYKDDKGWFFIDETESHSYGPYYSEEEANQEMALYNAIELEGSLKKIAFPGLTKDWDWYDGPLIGTYEDVQGTYLFCLWDQEETRKFLSFRDCDGLSERVKDFYKNGYNNDEAPPIITYILRTERPIAWFELS